MDRKQVKLPVSSRDILKLFTLSRTNQILRGRSPVLDVPAPEQTKAWTELVASEILSAKVGIVPQPLEFNVNLVSSDPRKGTVDYFAFFLNMEKKSFYLTSRPVLIKRVSVIKVK